MTRRLQSSVLRLAVIGLVPFLLAPAAAGAHRVGSTSTPQIPTASSAAVADANELIREPWGPLLPTINTQAKAALANLDGDFMRGSGKIAGAKWSFGLGLANLQPHLSIANPPGFIAAGPDGFSIRAPLTGSWSLGVSGALTAHGDAKAFGKTLASGQVSVPFALSLSKLSLAATATLNSKDPTRPTLSAATIDAHLAVGGSLLVPQVTVDVQLARGSDGTLNATIPLTKGSIKFAGVGVDVQTGLTLKLLPFSSDFATSVTAPGVNLTANGTFVYALVYLGGKVAIHFPSPVNTVNLPFPPSVLGEFPIPLPSGFAQMLRFAGRGNVPAVWPAGPSTNRLGIAPPPPASLDFSSLRDTLEKGIAATHMPYQTVLSNDAPSPTAPRTGRLGPYTYGLDADSTIWTGHYLAAEAFRYAATHSGEALQRVTNLIGGLNNDFAATSDAVVTGPNLTYSSVSALEAGAVFARSVMPKRDLLGWSEPAQKRLGKQCLYVTATNGWQVGTATKRYATLAQAKQAKGSAPRVGIQPDGPVYGSGCGSADSDHPISRDQYSGIFMGLAYAYQLVPDVRPQVKALVDKALGFLLDPRHPWDVPLPPDDLSRTTFMGGFDAQLGLLRIGATIDPAKFGAAYDSVKEASALAWIPVWFSTIDPLFGYFKFNLGHAFLGPPLFLETDPTVRQNLLAAYGILRAPTATHRNAWFNLVDVLAGATSASSQSASNPALKLGDEIKSDLNDWMTRWTYVKNTNGMPTNLTSTTAANTLAGLWPNDVAQYASALGGKGLFATLPLPVYDRIGDGMDFVWQVSPFKTGVDFPSSGRQVGGKQCGTTPPSAPQIAACSSAVPLREGPGVDFLLTYWGAVYLNLLPG